MKWKVNGVLFFHSSSFHRQKATLTHSYTDVGNKTWAEQGTTCFVSNIRIKSKWEKKKQTRQKQKNTTTDSMCCGYDVLMLASDAVPLNFDYRFFGNDFQAFFLLNIFDFRFISFGQTYPAAVSFLFLFFFPFHSSLSRYYCELMS